MPYLICIHSVSKWFWFAYIAGRRAVTARHHSEPRPQNLLNAKRQSSINKWRSRHVFLQTMLQIIQKLKPEYICSFSKLELRRIDVCGKCISQISGKQCKITPSESPLHIHAHTHNVYISNNISFAYIFVVSFSMVWFGWRRNFYERDVVVTKYRHNTTSAKQNAAEFSEHAIRERDRRNQKLYKR